jgi:hypothetical protein
MKMKQRISVLLRAGMSCLAILLLALGVLCRAQLTTGDILGTVTDPTGAVIQGANVTVESLATHERRTAVTTGSGDYVVNLLLPGSYSITITAPGFMKYIAASVALAAGDRVRVNSVMAVGSAEQSVTVESAGSNLQTDSSNISSTISETATQDLPLNGRNFIQLVQLVPGANEGYPHNLASGAVDDARQSSSISVNGQSEQMNNELLDGADNNERLIGTAAVRPSIDAIAEMNVQTNNYSADVGRTGGGVINVITRAGTNQFHGDVFEFFRNDILNANNYNFGAKLPKGEWRQNQYGGSLGGPVRKDKLFFFGSYEGYRLVQGSAPSVSIVPTLYEEQHPGDFSDTDGPVLTSGQIDPVAADYFKLYPAPNHGTNEYIAGAKKTQNSDVYDARVDYSINPKNVMYGRFIYNVAHSINPGVFPNVNIMSMNLNPNTFVNDSPDQDYGVLLNYIHTFNSNLLLELKGAYARDNNQSGAFNEGLNPNEKFGQPGINTNNGDATQLAPIIMVSGSNLGNAFYLPLKDQDNTYQYLGAVTYTHGKHNIKAGASVIRRQLYSLQSSSPEGFWIFLNYPFFLQGQFISNGGRALDLYPPHLRTWEPAVYTQDDWHVFRNLTLNLGLRYDIFTPYTEISNHISTWDPVSESLLVAGQNGVSNTAGIQTDHHALQPRIGFSYNPGHNLVIRGGFGMSYFPENIASTSPLKNPPFVSSMPTCNSPGWGSTTCSAGYTTFADGFPLSTMDTPITINAPSVSIPSAFDPRFRMSYMEQYNLTVQKDWGGNVVSVGYIGMLGRQMMQWLNDLNVPPPNTCATSQCYQALRPYYAKYPGLGTVNFAQSHGVSSYNAFEATLKRRLKGGLSVNASYDWSHNLSDVDSYTGGATTAGVYFVPSQIRQIDWGNDNLDIPQRISVTALYQVPFGNNATGARGILIKGWQANLIYVRSSSNPFTVLNPAGVSGIIPSQSDRPNQVASFKEKKFSLQEYFNTAAFVSQTPGTLGSERVNQLFGPSFRHADFSLFKVFPVAERMNVEFRVEVFNLSNTANFANPNNTLGGANFGAITSSQYNYVPRVFQFSLKMSF